MEQVLDFLRRLHDNNDREWFDAHRAEWTRVKGRFAGFTQRLIDGIASFDGSVRGLRPQDCTYRIARDTRFSADKTPYAFLRGPIVYCVDMVWNKPLCNDDADLYRDVTIDTGKLPVRTALPDSSLLGPAYRAEADYMGRKVQLTLTPFCNIGQWYRKGEQKPRKNTKAFTYAIWLTGSKN